MAEQDRRSHTNEANDCEDLTGYDKGSITVANSLVSTDIATADSPSVLESSPDTNEQHDRVDGTSKPQVLGEIDPNSVALTSGASLKQTPPSQAKPNANADPKRVVIDDSVNEPVLAENEENDDVGDAGQTNEGPGIGIGTKKKKKRKPKSQRGLVLVSVRSDVVMLTWMSST